MKKLEIMFQDEEGRMYTSDEGLVISYCKLGKLTTLVKESSESLSDAVQRLEIPEYANAFLPSRFNPKTKILKGENYYAVYAIQFYSISDVIKCNQNI